jgi:hypothetical protein
MSGMFFCGAALGNHYLLDVVSSDVSNGEEQHRVRDLTMKPEVLIQRQEPQLGPKPSHECPAYWEQDEQPVETQYQTRTTRNPDGELKRVETGESRVGRLFEPAILSASREMPVAVKK